MTFTRTLSAETVVSTVPAGTPEQPYSFRVTGLTVEGLPFDETFTGDDSSTTIDLPAGTGFVLTVSRYGVSSLPSEPFDLVEPAALTVTVPDATKAAHVDSSPAA